MRIISNDSSSVEWVFLFVHLVEKGRKTETETERHKKRQRQ